MRVMLVQDVCVCVCVSLSLGAIIIENVIRPMESCIYLYTMMYIYIYIYCIHIYIFKFSLFGIAF